LSNTATAGIHHVTAIASNAQQNIDFYTGVLGLRLAKVTVNFDDPGTYHFYYSDYAGRPGTGLTFFVWDGAPHGHPGTGLATTVSFLIPPDSMPFWTDRLDSLGIGYDGPYERFDEQVISFIDPDGIDLELVAGPSVPEYGDPDFGPVPQAHAVHGFHGVTLTLASYERTAALLTNTFGYEAVHESGSRFRYATGSGDPGAVIDIVLEPSPRALRGRIAAGTVHHVALRTPDYEHELEVQERLRALRYEVTEVRDRYYFKSIYFREPGGVNFEVATDVPGFTIDEPLESLGTSLKYPPRYDYDRESLESLLPPVRLPEGTIVP
jgi:glyoxalase family protein